jgi:hypothetical protein
MAAAPRAESLIARANKVAETQNPLVTVRGLAIAGTAAFVAIGFRNDAAFAERSAKLEEKMAGVKAELGEKMAGVKAELGEKMAGVKAELDKEVAGLEKTLDAKMAGVAAGAADKAKAATLEVLKDYRISVAGGEAGKA